MSVIDSLGINKERSYKYRLNDIREYNQLLFMEDKEIEDCC